MPNPCTAAAWSYFYRLRSTAMWLLVVFVVALNFVVLDIVSLKHGGTRPSLPLLIPALTLVILASIHGRASAIEARARVLPLGARAHAVVLAAVLLFLVTCEALLLYYAGCGPMLSLFAVTAFAAATAACMALRRLWLVWVAYPFCEAVSANMRLEARAWDLVANPQHPEIAWAIVGFAIAWLLFELRHLTQLNEQSWGYAGLRGSEWRSAFRSTDELSISYRAGIYLNRFNPFVPSSRVIDRAIQRGQSPAFWTRCQRWQILMSPVLLILMAVLVVVPQAAIQLFVMERPQSTQVECFMIQMAMMFAVTMPLAGLFQQRRFQTTDILKPITREAYFRELGASVALTMVRNFGLTCAVLLPVVWLLTRGHLDMPVMIGLLGTNILLAIFAYGCSVWILSFGTTNGVILAQLISSVPFLIAVPFWSADRFPLPIADYRYAVLESCAILALLGIYLTRSAYRCWLLADLG